MELACKTAKFWILMLINSVVLFYNPKTSYVYLTFSYQLHKLGRERWAIIQITSMKTLPYTTLFKHTKLSCYRALKASLMASCFIWVINDEKPRFQQWYRSAYDQTKNEVGDKRCCHCLYEYHQSEEWLQFPVCQK